MAKKPAPKKGKPADKSKAFSAYMGKKGKSGPAMTKSKSNC